MNTVSIDPFADAGRLPDETVNSPLQFLKQELHDIRHHETLHAYEHWWAHEGQAISDAVDRAGTPWLKMFDRSGKRVDELLFLPEYRKMLRQGYEHGVLWRIAEDSLLPAYHLIHITSFYDPGLACPYTVSLATTVALLKYGDGRLQERFLPNLLRKDGSNWQGATWMTEIKGGSDLGAAVETSARKCGDYWRLTGDKYFASNVGAELAVVAARPEGAPSGVRGLSLFLVPQRRADGELNYLIRRLKDKVATRSVPTGEVELRDSEAYLLGEGRAGIYLILEVLNVSRIANSVGSVALAQRALADAWRYARQRSAFGKPVAQHPLLCRQFAERWHALRAASALAWEAARLLDSVWREQPPYSDRYHLFRLTAHLAKYWTAELAAQTAKWAMEVHGGLGILQEFGVERWLREAMILAIWEGTAHRQILDGLEVMERKAAHQMLLRHLGDSLPTAEADRITRRVTELLALPGDEKQAQAESVVFNDLAIATGEALLRKNARPHEVAA